MTQVSLDYVLGAALQAQHSVSLAAWVGIGVRSTQLFDDTWPARSVGALGRPISGTISDGVARAAAAAGRACTLVAIGSRGAAFRFRVYRDLVQSGVSLLTVVHPSAFIAPDTVVGQNVLVMPGCVLSAQVRVGSLVCLFANVTIEHDCFVGDNVTMGPGVTLSGGARVEAHAFVGAGAVVAPGVTVGAGTLVGAGAVVVRNLPASVVAAGVPARVLRAPRAGDDVPTPADTMELEAL